MAAIDGVMKQLLFLTLLILMLVKPHPSFAQIFYSTAATEQVSINEIQLLITEVSFNSDQHDSFKLTAWGKSSNSDIDLQGYSIFVDGSLFKFTNFTVKPYQEITVEFKHANEEQKVPLIKLIEKGLTATTEQIVVKNKSDQIIDAVCWQNSKPAKTEIKEIEKLINNAAWSGNCFNSEFVKKNDIIKRKKSFQDTNSKDDWELKNVSQTLTITSPQKPQVNNANSIVAKPSNNDTINIPVQIASINSAFAGNTSLAPLITEIFPNPKGKDDGLEWIEIFNPHAQDIDLSKWQITTSSKKIPLPASLKAKEYYLLGKSNKITLKNTIETLQLIDPNKKIHQEVSYQKAPEDHSYNLIKDEWLWSNLSTPLAENEIMESSAENLETAGTSIEGQFSNQIFITEVFPNPAGKDEGAEWIEIFNASDEEVNLKNWLISNSSKENKFSEDLIIEAQTFLVLTNEDFKFSLKNSNEQLSLIDFSGNVIDLVEYQKSEENLSYSLINNEDQEKSWLWTIATPDQENLQLTSIEGEIKNFDAESGILEIEDSNSKKTYSVKLDSNNKFNQLAFVPGEKIKLTAFENQNHQYQIQEVLQLPATKGEQAQSSSGGDKNNTRLKSIFYFIILILAILLTTKSIEKIKPRLQLFRQRKKFHKQLLKIFYQLAPSGFKNSASSK